MSTFELCLLIAMGCLSVATIIVSIRSSIIERQLKMTQHLLTHFIEATVNEIGEMHVTLNSKGKKTNARTN